MGRRLPTRLPVCGPVAGWAGSPRPSQGGAGASRQSHRPSGSGRSLKGAPFGRVATRWPSATLDRPTRTGKRKDCRETPKETGRSMMEGRVSQGPGEGPGAGPPDIRPLKSRIPDTYATTRTRG
ncbi:hypothetical protein GCM10017750_50590 [Streptomyces racemochromogenes]